MYLSTTQTTNYRISLFWQKMGDGRRIPRQLDCLDRDYGLGLPLHKLPGIASRARSTIYDLALTRPVINGFRAQLRDAFSSKAITSIANDLFPFSGWKFSFFSCATSLSSDERPILSPIMAWRIINCPFMSGAFGYFDWCERFVLNRPAEVSDSLVSTVLTQLPREIWAQKPAWAATFGQNAVDKHLQKPAAMFLLRISRLIQ